MKRMLSIDAELQDDGRYFVRVFLKDADTDDILEDLSDRADLVRNAQKQVKALDPDAEFVEAPPHD